MNVLVVGFGGMGCRHVQSLLGHTNYNFFVVEPNKDVFENNVARINSSPERFTYFQSLEELNTSIDYAIIATTSESRFEIVKKLINRGVKLFLIEKIVFQSIDQFSEIISLCNKHDVKTYCNLPNRYFSNYIRIKNKIEKNPKAKIYIEIIGAEFGLACNAIHYCDLFEYLTGSKLTITAGNLMVSITPNRRGQNYKELLGSIQGVNNKEDSFLITSQRGHQGGVVVVISVGSDKHILFEDLGKEIYYYGTKIEDTEFKLIPSSVLTDLITKDIFSGKSILPSVDEVSGAHEQLFKIFNPAFGLVDSPSTLCPIT